VLRHSPVDGDHSLISLSPFPPPLTSFEPSGAHTTHKTAPLLIIDFFSNGALRLSPVSGGDQKKKSLANLWPSSVFRRSPFFGSHRMILLSSPPLARTLPSDEKATDLTQLLPFSQTSGNTYVTRKATCGLRGCCYLWPSRVLRHSPVDGDHSLISLSSTISPYPPPLTSFEPSGAHTTHKTSPLLIIDFFSNGALRLSPGERGRPKKKAWLTCGPRASSGARPFLGPTE